MKKVLFSFLCMLAIQFSVNSQSNYSWLYAAGGTGDDQVLSTTTDASGNIYAVGFFTGTVNFGGSNNLTSSGDKDLFLVKLNSSGVIQWAKKGGGSASDQAIDVKCDALGNIYTLGWHEGNATFGTTTIDNADGAKSFITKWDNNGNVLSVYKLGGYAKSFAIDVNHNLYVTSSFTGTIKVVTTTKISQGANDMYVAKFNPSGAELWVKTVYSSGNENPISLTIAADDSLIVMGRFSAILNFEGSSLQGANNGGATSEDLFIAKYSNAGDIGWFKQFDAAMVDVLAPNSIITDANNNLYVTGAFQTSVNFYSYFFNSAGGTDAFICKLSPNASSAFWAKKNGGALADASLAIGLDNSNNVYFAGYYSGNLTFETTELPNNTNENIFLAKYSNDGVFQWVKHAGGTSADAGLGVSIAGDGSAIIGGRYSGTANFHGTNSTSIGGNDLFVVKSPSTYTPLLNASFSASSTNTMATTPITFSDNSVGTPNAWAWSFPGAVVDTSNVQNPVVTYNTPGVYSVTLVVSNPFGETSQLVKTNYITITPLVSTCNAAQFDGIDDHIDCGSRSGLSVNQNFTIEAWVKPELASGFPVSYMTKTATSVNGYAMGYYNGKFRFVIQTTNILIGEVDNMPSVELPLNEWSHVACTYDGMVAKIYLNGVLAESKTLASSSTAITWSTTPAAIYIGKCVNTAGSEFFKGAVDDVRIWKTVRTDSQIFNFKDVKLLGSETNLGAYWNLDEGTGLLANDGTANNYDGTLKNGTTWDATNNACFGVNIQEIDDNRASVSIFPNPVVDRFELDAKVYDSAMLTIMDVAGKVVLHMQLEPDHKMVDVSMLKAGVYVLQIKNNQLFETSKFIKK